MENKEAIEYLLYMKHNVIARSPMDIAIDTAIESLKAQTVNRWIPVEDALPDALQNVLVCTDINTITVAWINGDGWTFADTGNGHTENWSFEAVQYWMHLPEPPEKE